MYDKLLKLWQSFWITLYIILYKSMYHACIKIIVDILICAMWLPFQRQEFSCQLINSRLVVQWESMIAHVEGAKSRFAPIKHSSGTSRRLNYYMFFQKDKACMWICTSTWVALSYICVTTVNMRIVFYHKISEYAHCLQQVQLLLTDIM